MPDTELVRRDVAKRMAAVRAASLVEDGMRVGLGTGSTTAIAIEEIGRRVREEGLSILGAPTSASAYLLARRHGVPLRSLDELGRLDIALDGADEVDPNLDLIKGRGGALTQEKVIASVADRVVIVADDSKLVDQLGSRVPVPIEILPMAAGAISIRIQDLGGVPELRQAVRKDGPVVTDQGFWIIDARFETITDLQSLDRELLAIPGVLDHGLFIGLATDAFVGSGSGDTRHLQRTETD